MSKENDEVILQLKEQIAKKKAELGDVERFNPVTNCSMDMSGLRFNLNTLDEGELKRAGAHLHAMQKSADELGFGELWYSGFTTSQWLTDINARLRVLAHKGEEQKLAALEKKLEKLLSDDKKAELELAEITRELGLGDKS